MKSALLGKECVLFIINIDMGSVNICDNPQQKVFSRGYT